MTKVIGCDEPRATFSSLDYPIDNHSVRTDGSAQVACSSTNKIWWMVLALLEWGLALTNVSRV